MHGQHAAMVDGRVAVQLKMHVERGKEAEAAKLKAEATVGPPPPRLVLKLFHGLLILPYRIARHV